MKKDVLKNFNKSIDNHAACGMKITFTERQTK